MASEAPKRTFGVDKQYHSLPNKEPHDLSTVHPSKHSPSYRTPRNKIRAWIRTILFQAFAVSWLVPIIVLLVLNFNSYIIGATAWCPSRRCYVDLFNTDPSVPENNIARFAANDRNLNAALQLVAKVLERWFEFIAASLMYLILVRIASSPEGLPVGLMTRHVQFSDLVRCFQPLFWRILPARRANRERIRSISFIWGFMFLSVILAILCNLMGPATAVLVIPTLRWIQTPMEGSMYMHSLNAGSPPVRNEKSTLLDGCSDSDIQKKSWSCIDSKYDNVVAGSFVKTNQCIFSINRTIESFTDLNWVPNTLTVNDMDRDWLMVLALSQNRTLKPEDADNLLQSQQWAADVYKNFDTEKPSFTEYNKSLDVQLQRTGPILATYDSFWNSDELPVGDNTAFSVHNVSDDKQIRCYPFYQAATMIGENPDGINNANNFTRCIQTGPGWGAETKQETFYIKGKGDRTNVFPVYTKRTENETNTSQQLNNTDPTDGRPEQIVQVNVFSSNHAVLLPNGTLPDGISPECLNSAQPPSPTCDWDTFFSSGTPQFFSNLTKYPVTVEYILQSSDDQTYEGAAVVNDFVAFLGFTNYTLDVSPISNPASLIRTREHPSSLVPVPVDPNWVLAAWSADAGGSLFANRSTTISVLNMFASGEWDSYSNQKAFPQELLAAKTLRMLPLYTLSTLEYERNNTSPTTDGGTSTGLRRSALINVWAYGISSRTSYLGAIVAFAGCVIVVLEVTVGLTDTRERRSLWQLLVAALNHKPIDEFRNLRADKDTAVAKVRFRLEETESTGKFEFLPPDAECERPRRSKNKSID